MDLIGHKEQLEKLRTALASGQLAHAYLFSGVEGIGKKLAALEFVRTLFCGNRDLQGMPCGTCIQCQKIGHGTHPDVFRLEVMEEKKDIIIDQTRELQASIQMHPLEGKYKVVIIDNAELMNQAAANSVLKTLEEPPENTVFFLITSRLNMLLPTIVSRCQKMFFSPPPEADSIKLIKERLEVDEAKARLLYTLTCGSIGGALNFPEEMVAEVIAGLKILWQGTSPKEILALSEKWGKGDDADPLNVLTVLMSIYRDIYVAKTTGKPTMFSELKREIEKAASSLSQDSLQRKLSAIQSAQQDAETTYNKQLMFEQLLFTLAI